MGKLSQLRSFFCYTLFSQIKGFNWALCPSRFASSNLLIWNGMNAASTGPVASILLPAGLYDTCVFSFKSDLLVLGYWSKSIHVCVSSECVRLRQWVSRRKQHMCFPLLKKKKLCQIGGRKSGRLLPIPATTGTITRKKICELQRAYWRVCAFYYCKWHDFSYKQGT